MPVSEKLKPSELAAVRWYLGQLLALLAFAGCFAIEIGADGLVAAVLLLTLMVSLRPSLVDRIPGAVAKAAPVLLLSAILADFLLSRGDVLPPLFRMIVLLTGYRCLQPRGYREDLQLLLLTLFLSIFTGVLSLEISFGLQMLFFAPIAMGLLFAINLSQANPSDAGLTTGKEKGMNWTPVSTWKRVRTRMDRRILYAGAFLYFFMTGMALLLFILMPRFDIGAALPFPRLQTAQSLSGFTDHVRYGEVVGILEDDSIAMRVDVSMDNPPARPYWRMVVLDGYYDGGFLVSPQVARGNRFLSDYEFQFKAYEGGADAPDSLWTLYLEGGVSSYLPTGDAFSSLRFNNRTDLFLNELTRVLQTRETNATTLSLRYRNLTFGGRIPMTSRDHALRSLVPRSVDTSDRSYLGEIRYPESLLAVPSGETNERILESVLGSVGPPVDGDVSSFANRLVRHLQSGRGYSLESSIPQGDGDVLMRWIASGRSGHCELYAGAFVLVSRYAGIPARMVVGFVGGDWNGFENYYMVRNRHAHAWCEVLDSSGDWIRVDPTPGSGVPADTVDAALEGGRLFLDRTLTAYLDSLRILWFRRVIQFDGGDQQAMADSVRGVGTAGLEWIRTRIAGLRESLKGGWGEALAEGGVFRVAADVLMPATVVGISGLLIWVFHRKRKRKTFEERMRRRAGNLLRQIGQVDEARPAISMAERIRYGHRDTWPKQVGKVLRSIRRSPRDWNPSTSRT